MLDNFKIKDLYYKDTGGTKPAILLLHGFLENCHMWDAFMPILETNHRVIRLDLPGHGKTKIASDNHTVELMARILNVFLEELSIDEIIIIGHSMGGYIAFSLANLYREKIKAMLLLNSTPLPDNGAQKAMRARAAELIKENFKLYVFGSIPQLFTLEEREKYNTEIKQLYKRVLKTSKKGAIATLKGLKTRPDSRCLLSTLNFPVRFILGRYDQKISIMSIQTTPRQENTRIITMNSGHMSYITHVAKVSMYLYDFLTELAIQH